MRGYSLMQGLHKQEREETFDRDGFYHTGDVGHFDADGHLFFEARLGDMIKTAGANVAPREVEVLLEAMPEVSSAYVVGVADATRGQNVAAALVLKPGRARRRDVSRAAAQGRSRPTRSRATSSSWPRTSCPSPTAGKIDKRKLAPLLEERCATGVERATAFNAVHCLSAAGRSCVAERGACSPARGPGPAAAR